MLLILATAATAASAAAASLASTYSPAAVVPAVPAVPPISVVVVVGGRWPDSHSGGVTGFGIGSGGLMICRAGGGAGVGTTLSSLVLLVTGSPVSPCSARWSSAVSSLAATL